jgi:hypothetical protein
VKEAAMPGMGPLPKPDDQRRRKNAPTIPTTNLPAAGRQGECPDPPPWMELGQRAEAFWAWAWSLPQAAGWSVGDHPLVARRAMLEDDLEALDLPDVDLSGSAREIESAFRCIKSLAGGKLAVLKEARELDDRLGLSPKGLAALRWRIVADEPDVKKPRHGASIHRLQAVDARAVAGA